jgi:hypothetical protein
MECKIIAAQNRVFAGYFASAVSGISLAAAHPHG